EDPQSAARVLQEPAARLDHGRGDEDDLARLPDRDQRHRRDRRLDLYVVQNYVLSTELMRRATSARHSSTGWKPGCFFASRSAQAQSSSSERRISIGRRNGCFTYQGVSTNSSMRLPSGSWKYTESALPCDTGWSSLTSSLRTRRYISRRPEKSAMRKEIWLIGLNGSSRGRPVASTI